MGIFGDLFDFNGDGKLDFVEQAAEFELLDELTSSDSDDDDDFDDDDF